MLDHNMERMGLHSFAPRNFFGPKKFTKMQNFTRHQITSHKGVS